MDKLSEQRNPAPRNRPPAQEQDRRNRPGAERRRPDSSERARDGFNRRRSGPSEPRPDPNQNRHDPVWHRDVGQPESPLDPTTFRLFLALTLPEAAIEEIGTFINEMPTMAAQNVRWTPRENVHLTLLFLGDTSVELLTKLREQIADAASNTSPFTLRLGEVGAFPSYHSPKILWVGLAGEVRKLMQLQGRIEGSLRTIGFQPERRPFTPHITVGRTVRDLTRQYEGDVGFSWRRSALPSERAAVPVQEIQLLRSQLQSGGAQYESIFAAPLG